MKIKVKPNIQGAKTPFISHNKNERGITLISLITGIIILVILLPINIKNVIVVGISFCYLNLKKFIKKRSVVILQ